MRGTFQPIGKDFPAQMLTERSFDVDGILVTGIIDPDIDGLICAPALIDKASAVCKNFVIFAVSEGRMKVLT